jgi:hypothetical protein
MRELFAFLQPSCSTPDAIEFSPRHFHAMQLMSASIRFSALALFALSSVSLAQQPKDGTAVLERMRAAYEGKWYHTLTFVQKTTSTRQDGTKNVTTWYESLRHTSANGVQLRIDVGDPNAGNGVLYTPDSSWRVREGKLVAANASGNEFLPLIEGVYVQPIAQTVREIKKMNVDLSSVRAAEWRGRPVWVVGASTASDTTSPQFWVDQKQNVVVRAIVRFSPTVLADIDLGGYVNVGAAMLATKIVLSVGGKVFQDEEYSDWKVDVPLPAALFDIASWNTAPHWAKKP